MLSDVGLPSAIRNPPSTIRDHCVRAGEGECIDLESSTLISATRGHEDFFER